MGVEEENNAENLASLDASVLVCMVCMDWAHMVAALHSPEAELVEDVSHVVANLPRRWVSLDSFVLVGMVYIDWAHMVAALHSPEAEMGEDVSRVVANLPQKWVS